MSVVVVVPPEPIVTPDQIPGGHGSDDAFVTAMIAAATSTIDGPGGWLGRCLGVQTLELRFDHFPCRDAGAFALPFPPAIGLVSIVYRDDAGVDRTIDPNRYVRLGEEWVAPVKGQVWPSTNGDPDAVKVQYRAGYETPPANAVAAIMLMTSDLMAGLAANGGLRSFQVEGAFTRQFNSPEAMSRIRTSTIDNLLAPLRIYT